MKSIICGLMICFCANFAMANEPHPSIEDQIGIKVGDVLKSVDGKSMTTPAQAMEAHTKLSSPGKHVVQFERDGKLQTMKYEITPAMKLIK